MTACPKCHELLHYATSGLLCRACGFEKCHWTVLNCSMCGDELEESDKTSGICVFCTYKIMESSK